MESRFKKAMQQVLNKAWEDDAFRAALVENPKSAIKSLTGEQVPSDMNLVITDQSHHTDKNTMYVNIPPKPDTSDMELSEEQLDMVAGGSTWMPDSATCGMTC